MKFIISGKNIEITQGLRSAVESKIGKLEKYFTQDTEVHVTLSVEKDRQKIEVTIPVKGSIIRSEQTSNDMYVSIDLVEEVIERQLKKYRIKSRTSISQAATSSRPLLKRNIRKKRKCRLSGPRSLTSSRCIPKTHVSRWNCLGIISLYSLMRKPNRLTLCIREKEILTD